ncbi:MAG TPA: hypothetical protein VNO26_07785 [Candidatus Limnocylindria bacterium]|nr:hypothetical protein [Candidatus Limnocylindria bacterium]
MKIGDRVVLPGGQRGTVVAETVFGTNGACRYTVTLDDGGSGEYLDFELRPAA